ncbi:hypothetical protein [Paraburkholderia lycopersici]|uniref:Hippurate hydrolase n=1 Tax=Paraburkholderia lycopersici TaxID=416944 RepID=A0A1G6X6M0_9BURK|nr:hypothetical protein [Paraburkholderia lycopersici]SDD73768.1 hippurate hydrolase [Paraburkholderia lycopersici]
MPNLVETVAPAIGALLHEPEPRHEEMHRHPGLSMREWRTASLVPRQVRVTGGAAVLCNGEAPAAMRHAGVHAPVLDPMRAGFDAMPCAAAARPGRESEAA